MNGHLSPDDDHPLVITVVDAEPIEARWIPVWHLALARNEYERLGAFHPVAHTARAVRQQWSHHGTLPNDTDRTHTALFFEQRRYRHSGRNPQPREIPYLLALYEACRHDPRFACDQPGPPPLP